jgi:hypothetical protein
MIPRGQEGYLSPWKKCARLDWIGAILVLVSSSLPFLLTPLLEIAANVKANRLSFLSRASRPASSFLFRKAVSRSLGTLDLSYVLLLFPNQAPELQTDRLPLSMKGVQIAELVVFGVLVLIFVAWEFRVGEKAILPLHLFKRRSIVGACIASFFLMMVMLSGTYYLPLFYQGSSFLHFTQSGP